VRILLIQPDYDPGPVGFRLVAMPEPLALELVAATVPDHDVRILDLRVDRGLKEAVADFDPELVAVTALTTEVYAAREVLQRVKHLSPGVFTAVGGHHATLRSEDFELPYVDGVCLGEGEFVFPQLVGAVAAGRSLRDVPNLVWRDDGRFVRNSRHTPHVDADIIPHPRRDLVAGCRDAYSWLWDRPDTAVATSRGCPYRCNFCSVWQFHGGRVRQMSAARVLDEIRTAATAHITFVDDNFMLNARRENEIADRIEAEGLRVRWGMECRTDSIVRHPELIEKWAGIGLENVLLGLEGISDETLSGVNKNNTAQTNDEAIHILHANGVMIWGAFIVDPGWTAEQFTALRDYVDEKWITHLQATVLTPLPGTQLYRRRRAELLTDDYACFDTLHAVVPTRLPREQFYQHLAGLYVRPNIEPIEHYLRQGRLTMEAVRFGQRVYRQFSRWQAYAERDPILGHPASARPRRRPVTSEQSLAVGFLHHERAGQRDQGGQQEDDEDHLVAGDGIASGDALRIRIEHPAQQRHEHRPAEKREEVHRADGGSGNLDRE
jgi:radical SAM superfamily enzyme YgiQ (UPF0313 family)